ncbi:hypothetical protein Pelo_9865 [Pelomyxa schiedti]|nr:hypothetical protein Pelo_9865 [Pelomyxa schiedti]
MRDKPQGTGIKVYLLVDEYSAIVKFVMYDGDNPYGDLDWNKTLKSPFFRHLNLTHESLHPTEATVYSLLSAVHWCQATRLCMDRYFPMANLMRNLHNSGFEFVVIIQSSRAGKIFSHIQSHAMRRPLKLDLNIDLVWYTTTASTITMSTGSTNVRPVMPLTIGNTSGQQSVPGRFCCGERTKPDCCIVQSITVELV